MEPDSELEENVDELSYKESAQSEEDFEVLEDPDFEKMQPGVFTLTQIQGRCAVNTLQQR